MSDVTLDEVDARGRAAGIAERRAASLRARPDVPTRRGVQWMRPALITAVAALTVGGLVVVTTQRDTPPDDAAQAVVDTRYVIGNVVDGFEPAGAIGPGAGPGLSLPTLTWFGPEDGVSRVALLVDTGEGRDDEWLDGQLYEYVDDPVELTVQGQRVILADSNEFGEDGPRSMFVQVAPDRWVGTLSRSVDDEALKYLAAGFSIDAADRPSLDAAFLPQGVVDVGPGPIAPIQGFAGALSASGQRSYPLNQTGVMYLSDSMQEEVVGLFAAPQPRLLLAQALLLMGDPTPAARPDTLLFTNEVMGIQEILWESNGVSFALVATPGVTVAQLEEMADSVRPATPSEWLELEERLLTLLVDDQSSESVTEAAEPWPPFDASVVGTVIDEGNLPDGRAWSVSLGASSDDRYTVELWVDGAFFESWGNLDELLFEVGAIQVDDIDLVLAAWGSASSTGLELRVSNASADVITEPLVPIAPIPDLALAVYVGVHVGDVVGELLDRDGGVLART